MFVRDYMAKNPVVIPVGTGVRRAFQYCGSNKAGRNTADILTRISCRA